MRRLPIVFLALFAGLFASARAEAAPEDAREQSRAAFRRGVNLVNDGDYKAARDAFLEAYKLFAHPSILLNLGIARWRSGEYVEAEQDLVRFLSDDGGASPEEVQSGRAALSQAREHLGRLLRRNIAKLDEVAQPFVRDTHC